MMNARRSVVRVRRSRQKGSAMVELALTFMGFLMLTLGSMEFGWAIYAYNTCSYAAQTGARWASVNGSLSPSPATATSVTTYVQAQMVALDPNKTTVTSSWSPNNSPGSSVTVTVGYNVVPLVGLAIQSSFNVSSTAQMVIDH
jgi:Flp pilus assembly protein TadG